MQEENPLFEQKIKLLLEMQEKKTEQNLSLIRAALKKLAEELDMVKEQLSKVKEQQPKERQEELKTTTKKENPRQGNYSSADVDIQKMFYYGNK
ncbi:hypothetical protein DRJ22_02460 [Candidatus Woesearchaeota archaeon]|nr:MAG: hypothetical protein B6U93_04015 [Candidatus Woesearchaeota archaeon ex4484_78]RLE46243.1 MAG: hypothetical protein DRJ22_02460 [Candidatus Woesearchaeota archaeon]